MQLKHLTGILASLGLLTPSSAWQLEVHNQIGFMAEELVSDATKVMIKSILEPQYQGSLGRATGWADTVRKSTHPFSYTWHFLSVRNNSCQVEYPGDCQKGGCVVSAITNETAILEDCLEGLRHHQNVQTVKCSEALKFVAHFLGDIAQPMHTSGPAAGGNLVPVLFNGSLTNLHSVWDKQIIYAEVPLPDGPSGKALDPYFNSLLARIRADSFPVPRAGWNICDMDAGDAEECAVKWAEDSNKIVCEYCYGKLVNGTDLLTGREQYAKGAFPIIEQQIAKAAWRLAGWLDALVERVLAPGQDEGALRVQGGNGGLLDKAVDSWEL